ncbi:unnamed protein product [Phytophthora fragariaefolia]|uniref:Unnamed protein product n=1 Tax=Phytophthora fragariaefolia TaxID=1490495 RepID=A0A9W6XI47_9STRA|nr:unnamed protein product [Phytophthora fragariaefolia]
MVRYAEPTTARVTVRPQRYTGSPGCGSVEAQAQSSPPNSHVHMLYDGVIGQLESRLLVTSNCCSMNGVLSTLTWGTWDDAEWGAAQHEDGTADASAAAAAPVATAESAASSQNQRSLRKLRKKGLQAPKNSQIWFEELLERVEGTAFGRSKATYRCNPLRCLHEAEADVQPALPLIITINFLAKERIAAAQLTNVEIFCGFIDDYSKPFDVGIALHACGEATDMVMQKCLAERAAYVLAPCCVGKIKLSELAYPRSATLAVVLSRTEYEVLAKAADFGHSSSAAVAHTDINRRRRRCKTLLESDRNMRAEEAEYDTFMFVMHPPTATPKNDVLVGIPRNLSIEKTAASDRLFQLACEFTLSTDLLIRKAMLST